MRQSRQCWRTRAVDNTEVLWLLFCDLVLNRQVVVMPAPLIWLCLQIAYQLCFLLCQRTAAFMRIMDFLSGQNCYNCIFPKLLRQGTRTDISLLTWMAGGDILAASDGITRLFHERKKAVEIMAAFWPEPRRYQNRGGHDWRASPYRPASYCSSRHAAAEIGLKRSSVNRAFGMR